MSHFKSRFSKRLINKNREFVFYNELCRQNQTNLVRNILHVKSMIQIFGGFSF